MRDVGLLFPGQGAQKVGMGKALYDQSPEAREVFESAERVVPGLTEVLFEGPQETLTETQWCQPAIVTVSIAAFKAVEAHQQYRAVRPRFAAGLSLGEYSALIAAGALTFADGLKLVARRAALMHEAAARSKGAMAAVIGFDRARLEAICQEAGAEVANYNSHQQIVITGHADKVAAASARIQQEGARSVMPLDVAGGFHSSLMQPAADMFQEDLAAAAFRTPALPVISNVDATPQENPAHIRDNLAKQITSSVQWVDTVERMIREGVTFFLEIGPGTVLKGLMRRIDPNAIVYAIEKPADIDTLPF